ncbi:MAG: glycosyltransferase [Acidimicrobiia bacterium]|nr:glycosyltransferase [Acidimicrobiia bacterium]
MMPAAGRRDVLAVTSHLPWPLDSGGRLRTFHLLSAVAGHTSLRLVAGAHDAAGHQLDALADHGITVIPVPIDAGGWWREARRISSCGLQGTPYVLFGRHDRAAMHRAVSDEVRRQPPDVLYLDHLDAFAYRHHAPGAAVVMDLHNVYSRVAVRLARDYPPWHPLRWYLEREARLLEQVEARAAAAADEVFTVSETECDEIARHRARRPVLVPNGVDCSRYETLPGGRLTSEPVILFVGALGWPSNVEAVSFLATGALPAVRRTVPDARLVAVGRDPSPSVRRLSSQPGVTIAADVPDVRPYLEAAAVLAVPLTSGGGTRLKILEAFAAGLPVISTPVGSEGLGARDGQHLLVRDRAAFADGLATLLGDRARGASLAAHARELARTRFDWGVVGAVASRAIEAVGRHA